MARRRLAPVDPSRLTPNSQSKQIGGEVAVTDVPRAEHRHDFTSAAPIAQVAADAAAGAALEEIAETLRSAREEGRLVLILSVEQIAADYLVRDRIPVEDEEMTALKESICAHGQRTPIEVTPLGSEGDGPTSYGLISGWRRLAALKALHYETGEARFATVRALVLCPESAEAAYVAMVEENEIRVGLSYYERARVAARATERKVFPDEKAALLALFGTASRPKRSRIRAFLELFHALDAHLRFPQAIPERLGLRLVERLRNGAAPAIAAALDEAAPDTSEAELMLLDRLAAAPRHSDKADPAASELFPGVYIATRRRGNTLTLVLTGKAVTPTLEGVVRTALAELYSQGVLKT